MDAVNVFEIKVCLTESRIHMHIYRLLQVDALQVAFLDISEISIFLYAIKEKSNKKF